MKREYHPLLRPWLWLVVVPVQKLKALRAAKRMGIRDAGISTFGYEITYPHGDINIPTNEGIIYGKCPTPLRRGKASGRLVLWCPSCEAILNQDEVVQDDQFLKSMGVDPN